MNATVTRIEKPEDYPHRQLSIDISPSEYQELQGEPIRLDMLSWTNTEDIADYNPDEMVTVNES